MKAKKLTILQVGLDSLSDGQLKAKIDQFLASSESNLIVTVNPEFLLEARQNFRFNNLLNHAALALADGFGLQVMALFKGAYLRRQTGADLSVYLLALAEAEKRRVAIINWSGGLSSNDELRATLVKSYPALQVEIVATERGANFEQLEVLKKFQPEIVLCSLGAPYQEKLLAQLASVLTAKILVGVGGSLDYLTGRAKRAPQALRTIGLEWLWRLLINPRARAKRIWQAVVKFPICFVIDEWIHPWLYRPNVVGFIYQNNEVLIVNSAKETRDFWKLPQGGRDALETVRQAVRREMTEELSLSNYQIKAVYKNIFKYCWRSGYSIQGYKGQCQSLCLLDYRGDKSAMKLDEENRAYKWVRIDDLLNQVDPVNEKAYTLFIQKYRESLKS